MQIEELITKLQALREEHGNAPVMAYFDDHEHEDITAEWNEDDESNPCILITEG